MWVMQEVLLLKDPTARMARQRGGEQDGEETGIRGWGWGFSSKTSEYLSLKSHLFVSQHFNGLHFITDNRRLIYRVI